MRTEHIAFDGARFISTYEAEQHENRLFGEWLENPQESVNLQDFLEGLSDRAIDALNIGCTPRDAAKKLLKMYFLKQQEQK